MKIEVFDKLVNETDDFDTRQEVQRVELILEGLGSLDSFETAYVVYGKDVFPEKVETLINEQTNNILPLTYIDDVLVKQSAHLTNEEFITHSGIEFSIEEEHEHDCNGGCCCGHHH
ncbi:arsenic metallochaperone ArsD family protein [Granulicatella sp. zg-ZJ]|uniref:arsenic metallochaperone ArsD family protein n=1 Tax=unclassified Granulicatella TaxID=2630493 RepID=UPI0013C0F1BF|nr:MULTISPECIES: arsenic metallochaperone ArsD family protein [unclassified Granulicatella]MBS4750523.1 arsenic metallochaperone ArsD family protein [Carnobacteriaceae bacterium zg-ZUI78]NEW62534.1 arsenic metallochaperone ArsD family protein [Granulicatella sp. zg-ZJ]NEW66082.1 arsenic metallochaperone ArsD family protein [Granulicatella sp. zg-84]QMI85477.1 arsenic metallochaperone ArsD family protein [Carnobacteriaceae bacterium zg-84]